MHGMHISTHVRRHAKQKFGNSQLPRSAIKYYAKSTNEVSNLVIWVKVQKPGYQLRVAVPYCTCLYHCLAHAQRADCADYHYFMAYRTEKHSYTPTKSTPLTARLIAKGSYRSLDDDRFLNREEM